MTGVQTCALPISPSRVWSSFFRLLNVGVSLSSGYHTQSNGQTERLNQEIGRFLRSYCSQQQQDWCQYLVWAEYAQNSLVSASTDFQCVLEYQPLLFPWTGESVNLPLVDSWIQRSEGVWQSAHVRLQGAVRRQKIHADLRRRPAPQYATGQEVWLSTRNVRLRLACRKLSPDRKSTRLNSSH